jgi:RNAse (barnase) inhibitor barstar
VNFEHLKAVKGPWLHLVTSTAAAAQDAARGLERNIPGLAARQIRGSKARTVAALFDEISAALQFPIYFGENWDAFHDCLADLSWLRAQAVVLVFTDAGHLLDQATEAHVKNFAGVLNETVKDWNQPSLPNKPRPFHVVFLASPAEEESLRNRWQAAGLTLQRMK